MRPDTPHEIIQDHLSKALKLSKGLMHYLDEYNHYTMPLLTHIRNISLQTDWQALHEQGQTQDLLCAEMLVDETEARFLCFLMSMVNASAILEVGMFTGYSTAAFALHSNVEAKVTTIEREAYLTHQAAAYFTEHKINHKVDIINQDANFALANLSQAFDFIFIDANKDGYQNYYNIILDNGLLSRTGVICIDNTLLKGSVFNSDPSYRHADAMRSFNKYVAEDNRVTQVMLPIRDGLTLVRRQL